MYKNDKRKKIRRKNKNQRTKHHMQCDVAKDYRVNDNKHNIRRQFILNYQYLYYF